METATTTTALKTLTLTPFPHLQSPSLLRCLSLPRLARRLHLSLSSSSLSTEAVKNNGVPHGAGEAPGNEVVPKQHKILQVVLVSPQVFFCSEVKNVFAWLTILGNEISNIVDQEAVFHIPGNTGCIARTCAASAVGLHLVGPLGFQVDDAKLKRAGLDYWPYVVVKVHSSWAEFKHYFNQQEGEKRLLAFTKRGTNIHSDFSYRRGDYLIFGSETSGLPQEALEDCKSEEFGGGTVRIPMVETYVRCLNLSVSVGIALYEASRQLKYQQLQFSSENCSDSEQLFLTEDIFA